MQRYWLEINFGRTIMLKLFTFQNILAPAINHRLYFVERSAMHFGKRYLLLLTYCLCHVKQREVGRLSMAKKKIYRGDAHRRYDFAGANQEHRR